MSTDSSSGSGPSPQDGSPLSPEDSGLAVDTAGQQRTDRVSDQGGARQLRRLLLSLAANVTVLTGLLVYFGWKRADTQSRLLGVDESIFGMLEFPPLCASPHRRGNLRYRKIRARVIRLG